MFKFLVLIIKRKYYYSILRNNVSKNYFVFSLQRVLKIVKIIKLYDFKGKKTEFREKILNHSILLRK
jgi:hypothetical protein